MTFSRGSQRIVRLRNDTSVMDWKNVGVLLSHVIFLFSTGINHGIRRYIHNQHFKIMFQDSLLSILYFVFVIGWILLKCSYHSTASTPGVYHQYPLTFLYGFHLCKMATCGNFLLDLASVYSSHMTLWYFSGFLCPRYSVYLFCPNWPLSRITAFLYINHWIHSYFMWSSPITFFVNVYKCVAKSNGINCRGENAQRTNLGSWRGQPLQRECVGVHFSPVRLQALW